MKETQNWNPPPAWLGGSTPSEWYNPPAYRPPAEPGTNGLAIAALILGALGGVLLSVTFGFVALSEIKKTGQRGRGMAITGLILSGLWLLILAGAVVVMGLAGPTPGPFPAAGPIAAPGPVVSAPEPNTQGSTVRTPSLTSGDCVNGFQDNSLVTVPCANHHEGEVVGLFDLPDGPYPGEATIEAEANSLCSTQLRAYSPSADTNPTVGLFNLYPTAEGWNAGDLEVVCIARATSGSTTGSIYGR